jgi:hypothetical protein
MALDAQQSRNQIGECWLEFVLPEYLLGDGDLL